MVRPLAASLKKLESDLGVPATGVVDTATLAAAEDAIAKARAATTTASDSAGETTTTAR